MSMHHFQKKIRKIHEMKFLSDIAFSLKLSRFNLSIEWINKKCTLTEKIFRQINYLVLCLLNALLSRNFYQIHKCQNESPHSVEKEEIYSHQKNFVKSTPNVFRR